MLWPHKICPHRHQILVPDSDGAKCSIFPYLGTFCEYPWNERLQYQHHLEHLNYFLKELLRDLRGNLDQDNADRVSKSVNNLYTIVQNFEKKMEIKKQVSSRNKAKLSEDVRNLCAKFLEDNIFAEDPRKQSSYDSFPKFNEETLAPLDMDTLLKWAKDKKAECERIYQ